MRERQKRERAEDRVGEINYQQQVKQRTGKKTEIPNTRADKL